MNSHAEAPDPKSGVSANFTTSANKFDKLNKVVRPRGFEPLAYGLEGRCSIQLSYERIEKPVQDAKWCVRQESNPQPTDPKSVALSS